jgi:hypothetical protein
MHLALLHLAVFLAASCHLKFWGAECVRSRWDGRQKKDKTMEIQGSRKVDDTAILV